MENLAPSRSRFWFIGVNPDMKVTALPACNSSRLPKWVLSIYFCASKTRGSKATPLILEKQRVKA